MILSLDEQKGEVLGTLLVPLWWVEEKGALWGIV